MRFQKSSKYNEPHLNNADTSIKYNEVIERNVQNAQRNSLFAYPVTFRANSMEKSKRNNCSP